MSYGCVCLGEGELKTTVTSDQPATTDHFARHGRSHIHIIMVVLVVKRIFEYSNIRTVCQI